MRPYYIIGLILLCSCHQVSPAPATSPAPTTSPDIVFIMADDLGFSDVGVYGGEIRTENIDALAEDGTRLTNFYTENMCRPSRIALLTGSYPKASMRNFAMHPAATTIAELLKADGYQTYMSGKWHVAVEGETPSDRGFDHYYGIPQGATSFFSPEGLWRDGESAMSDLNDPDFYLTDALSETAAEYITDAEPDRPLFLFVAYTAPHWPLHAPKADIENYEGDYADGWEAIREDRYRRQIEMGIIEPDTPLSPLLSDTPRWSEAEDMEWDQRRMQTYAAQISAMDRGIGQIVEALENAGRLDNTMIIFTSDNGGNHVSIDAARYVAMGLQEKTASGLTVRPGNKADIMPGPADTYQSYGQGWATMSNTPFRYFKKFNHEGGIRVPFIIRWPDKVKAGEIDRKPAHLVDIFPTLQEATNALDNPSDFPIDGQSLQDRLSGQPGKTREPLFFDHSHGRALIDGAWKIVSIDEGPWELYNIDDDPVELNDLASVNMSKRDALIDRWTRKSLELKERNDRYAPDGGQK